MIITSSVRGVTDEKGVTVKSIDNCLFVGKSESLIRGICFGER